MRLTRIVSVSLMLLPCVTVALPHRGRGWRLLLQERHPLRSDGQCGLVGLPGKSPGKPECFFDCDVSYALAGLLVPGNLSRFFSTVSNLECLEDCWSGEESAPDHCLHLLLQDVLQKGVCDLPLTRTNQPIYVAGKTFRGVNISETCRLQADGQVTSNTCSPKTLELLTSSVSCNKAVVQQKGELLSTQVALFYLSNCLSNLDHILSQNISRPRRGRLNSGHFWINEKADIRTDIDYRNTRHRYPWICSLRARSQPPRHLCAVTVLAVPPQPLVIVGAAHCTFLCKDRGQGGKQLPSCCCHVNRPASCTNDQKICGPSPQVVDMLPGDAEIICGEWDTSDTPPEASGELFNIKLKITRIVKHPNFDVSEGPIGGSDIAVFHTSAASKTQAPLLRAACLPPSTRRLPNTGIHSGWSSAPPSTWLQKYAPQLLKYYGDFFKQWHYRMDIADKCRDAHKGVLTGLPVGHPSDSFYPPATFCAREMFRFICFATGESGSPLMAELPVVSGPNRYYVEGVQSFVKGCDVFYPRQVKVKYGTFEQGLTQASESPSIYSRLSCFLPWVAGQYGLRHRGEENQELCRESRGSRRVTRDCRTIPDSLHPSLSQAEERCILPFYYQGNLYNECMVSPLSDFVFQVVCPTRNSTLKVAGINSYGDKDYLQGYCLNEDGEVDPEQEDCQLAASCAVRLEGCLRPRIPVFSQCKNDCPGAQGFGIVGGGSLVAAASGLASTGILQQKPLPSVVELGESNLTGYGLLKARTDCTSPFCRGQAGRCCLLIRSTRGTKCPRSC